MGQALGTPAQAGARFRSLGHLAYRERRLEAAERLLRLSIQYGEPAEVELGLSLLAQGRLSEAWPLYDQRHTRRRIVESDLIVPEWRGEDLSGLHLGVWREQGFGDQIAFARFLPELLQRGARVTYIGHPSIERLFRPLGVDYLATTGGASFEGFDRWVPALSLAARLGADIRRPPYLSAAPRRSSGRVGVMTAGNPANSQDAHRSLPPSISAELHAIPGAVDLSPQSTGAADFQDTAEIIAGLDVVVSVDTSVAHLSAAMGKRTIVLLARERVEWFWSDGARPIWYPNAELLFQAPDGDWRPAIDAAKALVVGAAPKPVAPGPRPCGA